MRVAQQAFGQGGPRYNLRVIDVFTEERSAAEDLIDHQTSGPDVERGVDLRSRGGRMGAGGGGKGGREE